MKYSLNIFLIFLIFSSCSFDNKTGIWKDASEIKVEKDIKKKTNNRYVDIFENQTQFAKTINKPDDTKIYIDPVLINNNWYQENLNLSNKLFNFNFENKQLLINKSKKLKNNKYDYDIKFFSLDSPIYHNKNIISYDHKGTVYIYSILEKKKIFEYNFYKKTNKKVKKILNMAFFDDTIYVADNLGYLYALSFTQKELLWAKNFGIPFRSNIKVIEKNVFVAAENNNLYALNRYNGDEVFNFPTSPSKIKTNFQNNISIDEEKKSIFFLNTYGELYSVNYVTKKINWLLNLNESSLESSQIFFGSPLTIHSQHILLGHSQQISLINSLNGVTKWKLNIKTSTKPIISNNLVFVVSTNNFLICLDFDSGEVIWSKNIKSSFNKFSKIGRIINISLSNNLLRVFTLNGYILSFDYNSGNLIDGKHMSKKGIVSNPIFVNKTVSFFDKSFRFIVYE